MQGPQVLSLVRELRYPFVEAWPYTHTHSKTTTTKIKNIKNSKWKDQNQRDRREVQSGMMTRMG